MYNFYMQWSGSNTEYCPNPKLQACPATHFLLFSKRIRLEMPTDEQRETLNAAMHNILALLDYIMLADDLFTPADEDSQASFIVSLLPSSPHTHDRSLSLMANSTSSRTIGCWTFYHSLLIAQFLRIPKLPALMRKILSCIHSHPSILLPPFPIYLFFCSHLIFYLFLPLFFIQLDMLGFCSTLTS